MSQFHDSRWTDTRFAQEYRDQADSYLPERRRLIEITQSLYGHWIKTGQPRRILDLGCGDGLMVQELLKLDDHIDATLIDGSQEMLNAAGVRLAHSEKVHWIHASFQDLLKNDPLEGAFCFILSSLAIHHLEMKEKEALFGYAYRHLDPCGFFLNIDVVLPPTNDLEVWYLALWEEWIEKHVPDSQKAFLRTVPNKYKKNQDNVPDPLLSQLKALESIGFRNVDCFYKYGIFAAFGGCK